MCFVLQEKWLLRNLCVLGMFSWLSCSFWSLQWDQGICQRPPCLVWLVSSICVLSLFFRIVKFLQVYKRKLETDYLNIFLITYLMTVNYMIYLFVFIQAKRLIILGYFRDGRVLEEELLGMAITRLPFLGFN